jgi:hypothetical protein
MTPFHEWISLCLFAGCSVGLIAALVLSAIDR